MNAARALDAPPPLVDLPAPGSTAVTPFTSEGVSCAGGRCGVGRVLALRTGHWYSVVVKAYNLAGDWSLAQSSLLLVDDGVASDDQTLVVVLVVVCAVLVMVAAGSLLWFYMDWCAPHNHSP